MNKKLPFAANTKMADVIHYDYQLIPIIGRFGIEYGFGNKTIEMVCKEKGINVSFFLEIINSYHNQHYFPGKQLQNFNAKAILKYLSSAHSYYLKVKVPEIQSYIDELEKKVSPGIANSIKLLNRFLKKYQEELVDHLENEDKKIYPYIISLEEAFEQKIVTESLIARIKSEPIAKYERNHDDLEVKLNDFKNLIMKFMPSVFCMELCQRRLTELFRLESDIGDHTRIEEKVLVPKVKQMEVRILEFNAAN